MKFTRKQIKIFALRTIVNFRRYEIEKRHNKKKRLTINSFPKIFGKGVIKPEGFG